MSLTLQFLLILVIIVLVAKYAGSLSVRWGQPAVFGTILAGLILGPTFLNILGWPIFLSPEPQLGASVLEQVEHMPPVFEPIKLMAELGVILLMFLAGLETDLRQMMRVGRVAFWGAVGGVVGPLEPLDNYSAGFGRQAFAAARHQKQAAARMKIEPRRLMKAIRWIVFSMVSMVVSLS